MDCVFAVFAFSPFSRFRFFPFPCLAFSRFRVFVFRRRHPRGRDTDFVCTVFSTLAFGVSIRDLTNSPEGSLERSALGGAARPSSPNHRTPTAFAPRHGGDLGSGLLGLLVGLGRWLVRFVLSPNQFCCFEYSKPLERKAKDTVSNREVSCFLSKEAFGPEHLEPWDVRMAELQESLVMPCFHEAD